MRLAGQNCSNSNCTVAEFPAEIGYYFAGFGDALSPAIGTTFRFGHSVGMGSNFAFGHSVGIGIAFARGHFPPGIGGAVILFSAFIAKICGSRHGALNTRL